MSGVHGGDGFQRLAEVVAEHIRRRILSGELADGSLLPKEERLRDAFPVSKPTFREAMRILESEGLITVRRGNVGGAVVHRPTRRHLAYSLGLVLAAEKATIAEVARALQDIEPACAALCAQRADRAGAVVPRLRRLQERYWADVDDVVSAVARSRDFHEAIVALCGNRPLIVIAGALEDMWSAHEKGWASRIAESHSVLLEERHAAGEAHDRIIDLIADGDTEGVRRAAADHLRHAQRMPKPVRGASRVDPALVRRPNGRAFQ